jgi:hypothetical protein
MRYVPLLLVLCAQGCAGSGGSGSVDAPSALPDCTGTWPAEWAAKERALIDLVNAARVRGGTCFGVSLAPVAACVEDPVLTQFGRCFAREQAIAGTAALQGDLANGALRDRVVASGYPYELSGYDGDIVEATPEEVLAGFLATHYVCEALFNPATTVGGIGYVAYPAGGVPQRWAGLMAITATR